MISSYPLIARTKSRARLAEVDLRQPIRNLFGNSFSRAAIHMGTRHVRTLYDIAITGHHLKALCQGCGHKKIFDGPRLWWLYQRKGWDTSIKAIAAHLRCSECDGKNIVTSMTFEEPTGPQPMGPSDREWKEHIRRKRA